MSPLAIAVSKLERVDIKKRFASGYSLDRLSLGSYSKTTAWACVLTKQGRAGKGHSGPLLFIPCCHAALLLLGGHRIDEGKPVWSAISRHIVPSGCDRKRAIDTEANDSIGVAPYKGPDCTGKASVVVV